MNQSFVSKLAVVCSLAMIGCAAGESADDGSGGSTGDGGSGAVTGATGVTSGSGAESTTTTSSGFESTGSGMPPAGCEGNAGDIYLISKEYDLYKLAPASLELTKIGALACPQNGGTATPFSMSVDRSGMAWVLYNDGKLYKVSTSDASCQATSFVPDQSGFKKFGMGFVSDAPGSEDETLYIANEFGLGSIDLGTLTVSTHGQFGFSAAAELTGTGNAELYGFFYGFPPYIAKLDKQTSALGTEQDLDSVDAGTGFAFAFWGGAFWVFTGSTSSKLDRYDPATMMVETKIPSLGFKVVGAGVSTCAPVAVPQ
jgi:hypothetical protein